MDQESIDRKYRWKMFTAYAYVTCLIGGSILIVGWLVVMFFNYSIKPKNTAASQPPPPITAKDLPYPEVGIPGVVPPEGKTVHLNYKKSEAPVAIICRDVGGKVECRSAK